MYKFILNIILVSLWFGASAQTTKNYNLGGDYYLHYLDSMNTVIKKIPSTLREHFFYSKPNGKLFATVQSTWSSPYFSTIKDSQGNLVSGQPYLVNKRGNFYPIGLDTFGLMGWHHVPYDANCNDINAYILNNNPQVNACDYKKKYGYYVKGVSDVGGSPNIFSPLTRLLTKDSNIVDSWKSNGYSPRYNSCKRKKDFTYFTEERYQVSKYEVLIYLYSIKNGTEMILTDSLLVNLWDEIPIAFRDTALFNLTTWQSNSVFDNGCKNYYFIASITSSLKIAPSKKYYRKYSIKKYKIKNGKFDTTESFYPLSIDSHTEIPGDLTGFKYGPDLSTVAFVSPNNKFIYLSTHYNPNGLVNLVQYDVENNFNLKLIPTPVKLYLFFQNNAYGGLLLLGRDSLGKSMIVNYDNANNPINYTLLPSPEDIIQNGLFDRAEQYYDYLRFNHTITYKDCGAYLNFINRSDESLGITTYEWEIALDSGHTQWRKFTGKVLPTQFFKKSGTYFVKIHGLAADIDGYSEWWWDSINIDIPTKPQSIFTATPVQICAYNPVAFNNTSNQGQINPSMGVSYLWAFGDGDTSQAAFPKHSYNKAGVYDVTLITNNGYCADTLIKKQYITVVDAPKPGMVLAPTEGCTPFAVKVQELNTNPINSRTYDMGNGEVLYPTNTNFSYVYTTPGNFTITQTLSSASGCAATSTQLVKVHQGFAAIDSAHLYNGTYLNNRNIQLQWLPVNAAAGYAIFEGNTKIQETNAATLSATLVINEPKPLVYSIKAIDSCGNYSSAGLVSAPMLLQYQQEGNAVIHLNHSSYYNWAVPIVKYEIEYTYNSAMQFLGNTLNNQYDDKDFAPQQITGLSDTQKCYRIKAHSADGRISTSNVVCAAMLPMVFMPTAFTPNANGINDVYTPSMLGISTYELLVYNRWGQLVAHTHNQGWQANNVAEGVYNVLFFGKSVTGRQVNVNVTVTLLK